MSSGTQGAPDVLDVLRATALFADFTDEQLEMVPKVGHRCEFDAGDVIVAEREQSPGSLWLLLEGGVDVRAGGTTIHSLGPGGHFGEMALLTDDPIRSADVVATEPTVALELQRSHLLGLVSTSPEIALGMLAELARRLRQTTEVLQRVLDASPEAAATAEGLGVETERLGPAGLDPIVFALSSSERD